MPAVFADLHIHSCLSPCADDDMTPANICGMAKLKGLDAIAVTDHNSARNLPAVQAVADQYGLILLPGMEITTREEVHLLGYFPRVEVAVSAGEYFSSHLPSMPNKPDFFGHQLVMDAEDQVVDEETRLLIGATDLSLEDCTTYIRNRGGAAVPAHINRGANGLLINLGMMPLAPSFPVVEVSRTLPVPEEAIRGRRVLHSSDAHQLGVILEREFVLEPERFSVGSLLEYLNYMK